MGFSEDYLNNQRQLLILFFMSTIFFNLKKKSIRYEICELYLKLSLVMVYVLFPLLSFCCKLLFSVLFSLNLYICSPLCYMLSVLSALISDLCSMLYYKTVFCYRFCVLCSLLSAFCFLLSALCSPLSVIRSLLSSLCSLLSDLCFLISALFSLLSVLCSLPLV